MFYHSLGYVEDIYQVILCAIQAGKLKSARNDLKEMTPLPMSTRLVKQSKSEVILKKVQRKGMSIVDVPPTNPGSWF